MVYKQGSSVDTLTLGVVSGKPAPPHATPPQISTPGLDSISPGTP